MNIHVYLEDALGLQLNQYAHAMGKPRNMLIREAVKEWISHHQVKKWPDSILNFKGCPNMLAFESHRDDMLPPKEDPFV